MNNFEVEYLNLDKKKLDKPTPPAMWGHEGEKDYFWIIIGILTPLAIGSIIFFFWYLNLIINGLKPL